MVGERSRSGRPGAAAGPFLTGTRGLRVPGREPGVWAGVPTPTHRGRSCPCGLLGGRSWRCPPLAASPRATDAHPAQPGQPHQRPWLLKRSAPGPPRCAQAQRGSGRAPAHPSDLACTVVGSLCQAAQSSGPDHTAQLMCTQPSRGPDRASDSYHRRKPQDSRAAASSQNPRLAQLAKPVSIAESSTPGPPQPGLQAPHTCRPPPPLRHLASFRTLSLTLNDHLRGLDLDRIPAQTNCTHWPPWAGEHLGPEQVWDATGGSAGAEPACGWAAGGR